MLLPYSIRKIWRPELFQGNRKNTNYFEGWYFKIISENQQEKFALIPGVALGSAAKDAHAFIQLIDGKNGISDYFIFNIQDFTYSSCDF